MTPFTYPDPSDDRLCDHARLLRMSYRRLTGRDLIDPGLDDLTASRRLFEAPFALLSHNAAPDPILTYGNQRVLDLFELEWEELTRMPSRLTAEASDREERARLLAQVTAHGFIDHYSGVRVSSRGRRFRIDGAVVWNLIDEEGRYLGQAATFAHWRPLG